MSRRKEEKIASESFWIDSLVFDRFWFMAQLRKTDERVEKLVVYGEGEVKASNLIFLFHRSRDWFWSFTDNMRENNMPIKEINILLTQLGVERKLI
ncbi:hypothetical protein LCGC14_0642140 [marine sediment metagenome]|uniref:Uncharacterized protein n=1 Tax=marine sediment metagenome TaxID=412755 RepID=A0A0F9RIC1_9ZZZZ